MSSNAQRTSTTAKRPLEWMRFDPVKFMFLIEDLTFEEVGAVTKVMLKLWQFGPMSEVDLRKASKAHFEVIKNLTFEVDNLLSFELVEDARDHGERRRNQRVEAGIASAAKRNERLTTVQRTVNDRSTVVLSVSKSSSDSTSKRKEREVKVEPEPMAITWPRWAGPNTLAAWEEFKTYRWTEHKVKYQSVTTEQKAVNILSKFFPGGEECVNALEYSMGKRWQFPVDPAEHKYPTERKAVSTGWNPRA